MLATEKMDAEPSSISSAARFLPGLATAPNESFLAEPGVAAEGLPREGIGASGLAGESKILVVRGVGAGLILAAEDAVGRVRDDSRGRVGVGGTNAPSDFRGDLAGDFEVDDELSDDRPKSGR